MCVPYVQNPESTRMILRTLLEKGNGCHGKPARYARFSMMKKTAADLKAKGKKPGSTHGLLG